MQATDTFLYFWMCNFFWLLFRVDSGNLYRQHCHESQVEGMAKKLNFLIVLKKEVFLK